MLVGVSHFFVPVSGYISGHDEAENTHTNVGCTVIKLFKHQIDDITAVRCMNRI